MAAYLAITSNAPGSDPYVLFDGEPDVWTVLDDSSWGDPTWDDRYSGPRGTQGARAAQGVLGNRPVRLSLRVREGSADALASRLSELATIVDELRRFGGKITRRGSSQTYRQHLEVLGAKLTAPAWGKRFDNTYLADCSIELTCAPYALGDPMAWTQEVTTADELATLEVVEGTVGMGDNESTGPHAEVVGVTTTRGILVDALRGYRYGDVRVEALITVTGNLTTDFAQGVILRYIDADNWLAVTVEAEATVAYLRVRAMVAGVESVIATTSTGMSALAASRGWLSGWVEGNTVRGEWRGSGLMDPTPFSDYAAPAGTLTHQLTGDALAAFAAGTSGRVGVILAGRGSSTQAGLYRLRVRPFWYGSRTWPVVGNLRMEGSIPGDAPALADVTVTTPTANTTPARWAMIGWAPRRSGQNLVWNGAFEDDTDGWTVSAVSGITAAATSLTRNTTGVPRSGIANAILDTAASDTSGAAFRIWHSFKAGRVYQARAWLSANTGSGAAELALGVSGDLSVGTTQTPSGFVELTASWTPAADTTNAYVAVRADGTHGAAWRVDEVEVYDVTDSLDLVTQQGGLGGAPPLVVLPAIAAERSSGFTATTDADSLVGSVMARTGIAGSGSADVSFVVDPALTMPDDYTAGELDVEVWARIEPDDDLVGLRGFAWVNPVEAAYDSDSLGARRYASRFGSAGKPITRPATADAWRLVRLGNVPLVIDPDNPGLSRVTVSFSWQTGSTDSLNLDYVVLVPSRARALSPTGIDRSLGGYPEFLATHADEVAKTVRSDLSAYITAPPSRSRWTDHGLGGSLIELPSGDVDLVVVLSDLVPDDPDSTDDSAINVLTAAVAVSPTPRWAYIRDA
jgi:hypothetical protein